MNKLSYIFAGCGIAALTFLAVGVHSLSESLAVQKDTVVRSGGIAEAVEEVVFPEALAGFGTDSRSPWADYRNWPSSPDLKAEDTIYQSLFALFWRGSSQSLTDFNGDGLVDILHHDYNSDEIAIILLNTGNLGFEMAYRCYYDRSGSTATFLYYGDCADV